MKSPFYTAEHEAFRDVMRRFVENEIEPFAHEWDEAGEFPRTLYEKAAEVGLLGLGFPEEFGGVPADQFMKIVASQELARASAGGVSSSLMSHTIGAPPIARAARPEVRARVLPEVLAGKKISALAITEPSGGSDVANLRTKARCEDGHYVVNGEKTFITSGMRADYLTVAVRTGGEGASGVSLLLIEGDTPGLSRTKLKKMGWWASDTATLHFDDCRVPAQNLLGDPGGLSRRDHQSHHRHVGAELSGRAGLRARNAPRDGGLQRRLAELSEGEGRQYMGVAAADVRQRGREGAGLSRCHETSEHDSRIRMF
jgi:acyl-CoA dehydrogenase